MVQYGVWFCCLQRSWSWALGIPTGPIVGRVPNHVSGWQIAPCQWAVIPSAQHHVWLCAWVWPCCKALSVWNFHMFLAAEQCSNDVKRDNVKLTTECQQGLSCQSFAQPPVLVEASLLPWVSQTPNVFLDVICPWFRLGTRNVGPIGWNKFTYFSVYWQKECAWSCFCAKLQ